MAFPTTSSIRQFNLRFRSHGISDDELYQAIQSALQGKVVDLGGGGL